MPKTEGEYFILSLEHSVPADYGLTFWRPDNAGYTWDIGQAGRYTAEAVARQPSYYNNGRSTLAVRCKAVEALSIQVVPSNKLLALSAAAPLVVATEVTDAG